MRTINDGTRTLFESVMMSEIIVALRDWSKAQAGGVLIGALGLSYYARPRMTQDIDFLFLHDEDVPVSVKKFTRTGDHAFQHDATHVEINLMTTERVNAPLEVVQRVIEAATESDGIKIASASGLAALKLFRLSMQDKADLAALVKTGRVNVNGFALPPEKLQAFEVLEVEAWHDPHP
jgi:hypothetical protein